MICVLDCFSILKQVGINILIYYLSSLPTAVLRSLDTEDNKSYDSEKSENYDRFTNIL